MSIDVDREELIPFNDARSAFPGGKRRSLATLHRLRIRGVRCSDGSRVLLDTVLVLGARYTSREAIQRLIAAQNADQSPTPAITPKQRRTQAEAANRLLQEAGI